MKFDPFRIGAWVLSSLCLATSMGFIASRHSAFSDAAKRDATADLELQRAREEQDAVRKQPPEKRFAAAPRKPDEETKFITDLRQRAHAVGVTIVRWNSHTTTYEMPKEGGPPADSAPGRKLLVGYKRVDCDLALEGPYRSLRTFIAGLWEADRLYTMKHVDWNRTEKGSELSMTVSRYIAPAPPKTETKTTGISEGAAKP
ncbi:hypothetical protein EON82_19930 [bacterium]|nr:MAG: hypothetical protein EON82_19930 [bacterium]